MRHKLSLLFSMSLLGSRDRETDSHGKMRGRIIEKRHYGRFIAGQNKETVYSIQHRLYIDFVFITVVPGNRPYHIHNHSCIRYADFLGFVSSN
jgi:hypothetical protein